MGIHIEWDDDQQSIIRHVYDGLWTVEEYYALVDENYRLIDSVNHRVDIINDLSKMSGVPQNMIPAIKYAANKAHHNEGINVMVASPTFVKLLIGLVNNAVGDVTEVLHTDTVENARAMIERFRSQEPI